MTQLKVIVLVSHATAGPSMLRYSELIVMAIKNHYVVEIVRPPALFSAQLSPNSWQKVIAYIEKLACMVSLMWRVRREDALVVADHSDAIWTLLVTRPRRIAIACHDLLAVRAALGEFPQVRIGRLGRIYQLLVRRGLRRAGLLVSVSADTQSSVTRTLGRGSVVVHNPIDPRITVSGDEVLNPLPFDISTPFVLVVSGTGWRKDRGLALRAWHMACGHSAPVRLVIVGPPLLDYEVLQSGLNAEQLNLVVVITSIPDEALALLYASTMFTIIVSKYEGFCWPMVESHAAGTGVLARDSPVLREVGGEGARFFAETDSQSRIQDLALQAARLKSTDSVKRNAERFTFERYEARLIQVLDSWVKNVAP